MKLFGMELLARKPKPAAGSAALSAPADAGLAGGAAFEDMIQRAMLPQEVESILNGALCGDLAQQQQLFNSMCDTWDCLANNLRVIEDAAVGAPWEVLPATDEEGEVSDAAAEKAALVSAALAGMRPEPGTQELDADGIYKVLARGCLTGHEVIELLWERREHDGGMAILPRAARRTGAGYYGYAGGSGRTLQFRPSRSGTGQAFPAHKFLIHVVAAHAGHPSQAARLRTLCKYWGGATYGWEWLMVYSNKFGMPFRWATYKKESANVKANLLAMMGNLGIAGYGCFPDGTKIEMHEASRAAGELPFVLLLKLATQACDLVIRGEVQSSGTEKATGFSSGAVQGGVRREAMQGYCNAVCTTMQQFVRAVLMLNYGTCEDAPKIICEIPEPEDAKLNAERDEVLARMGLPLPIKWLLQRHDVPAAAEGEELLSPAPAPALPPVREMRAAKGAVVEPAAPAVTLEGVMERLLINAVIAGAGDFEEEADAADAREINETA